MKGHVEVVKVLETYGADLNMPNKVHEPLMVNNNSHLTNLLTSGLMNAGRSNCFDGGS